VAHRHGFTLIELLVVISFLVVLATLTVAVLPRLQERARASRGGDLLHGWFLEAKQMALRDRGPRGLRLLVQVDPQYGLVVRQAQYIQQPDNFTGGVLVFDTPGTPTAMQNKATIIGVALDGGFPQPPTYPPDLLQYPVQPGDYLQVQGGQAHLITHVYPPNPVAGTPGYVLTATTLWDPVNLPPAPATATPPYSTAEYQIIRQPRPITGEPVLDLPNDVVIDMNPPPNQHSVPDGTVAVTTLSGLSYDILFTPSGTVTGAIGESTGKIILWVRDPGQDPDQPGDQPLIVIFCRTGRSGGYPVNFNPALYPTGNPGAFPYYYVLDPRATGF
jgi:prepilin-type N-terminal cleavage/methylation domain-containing protein